MAVAFGYIVPTIIAILFVGYYAPLVGVIVGFLIHSFILLIKISEKLDKVIDKLENNENEKS
ncbi:hypothetical protein U5N28_16895 [Lysinibacillus telephonicus]|uniref:hypothetical protein n=1 Tax=Lysinibacillus telephonicus TaxID=1714840 RepID=UPI00397A8C72